MPALATLTLVWLGAQKPDAAHSVTLERWARDQGVKLEEPAAAPRADGQGSSLLAAQYEAWLEQARDQLQAGDEDAARELLTNLDQSLRQHPELLQASWLMAEAYRLRARLARRGSPDEALRLEQRAEITEGGRAPSFGETRSARAPLAEIQVRLAIHGARRHEIYWDGSPSGDRFPTPAGEHHLLVFRGLRLAWSGWVNALSPGTIDVWVPDAAPCSAEDLEGVAFEEKTRVRVPPDARCASWAVATPLDGNGMLSIAVCAGDQCQRPMTLGKNHLAAGPAFDERAASKSWLPPWAAWTLAGVGAAAATSIVLWRAGVFDAAPQSKVIYDGTNL